MKTYSLQAIDNFIQKYLEKWWTIRTFTEWVLWYWTTILEADFWTAVIQEVYLNEWSSWHTVRQYKNLPKKYL